MEALHGTSLCVGWQLIHAYLASEGSARKWANPIKTEAGIPRDWRNAPMALADIDEQDNLAI